MTVFIIAAAILALATAALVARGLLRRPTVARATSDELNAAVYRDQLAELDTQLAGASITAEHHARARDAIRERLAHELQVQSPVSAARSPRAMALATSFALVGGAALLYAWIGTPAALTAQPAQVAGKDGAHGLQSEQIVAMVQRLAMRLQANPDDVNGWVMLGRSYSALGRFGDAAGAYREAAQRSPGDAALLADFADVLAMAQGRRFDGEPDRIIEQALAADGGNVKALALAGTSAFGRKEYVKAVQHWSRIQAIVPPESEMGRSIEASIAQARSLASAGKAGEIGPRPVAAAAAAAGATSKVTGVVKLSPSLAKKVNAGDTLFIYARPTDGSRVPVAIARQPVSQWPVKFMLDDSSAMTPAMKLSALSAVAIEARISRTGEATPKPGDLRGVVAPVKVGASGVVVEIASVVQ